MDDTNEFSNQSPAVQAIGLVAAPIGQESTSVRFFFWVERDQLVEKTQMVRVSCRIGGQAITWYGTVEEVYRRSRKRSMDEEVDLFDGDLTYTPPFGPEGVTFADVAVLRTDPPLLTPPREQSLVMLGNEIDAAAAWDYSEMIDSLTSTDWGLPIGLIRNGGQHTVGVAKIDLRDLNGDRAGHLNVTGQAGRGTKSSFLTAIVRALVDTARQLDDGHSGRPPFAVRPIVFNVKGKDLMYIDLPNRYLTKEHRECWQQMGIEPRPFESAAFFSPCQVGSGPTNRDVPRVLRPVESERQTQTYYWTLDDVVRFGLWEYLFSDDVQHSEPMMALVGHILGQIADSCPIDEQHPAGLRLREGAVRSFSELRDELRVSMRDSNHSFRDGGVHTFGTVRALLSRLGLVLSDEGRSIFSDDGLGAGRPLQMIAPGTTDPVVIDIAALPHELRRFVVAAVLDQVKQHRMGHERVPGQVYFLVLDELGIYAPRGARDPITKLFEHVAAQLRSQGIILLGAQQQASVVSETIFGNSQFKVLGASSPVEIESPAWRRLLSGPQKTRALMLRPEEKMVLLDRGWMNIVVPFPAWAMKESEANLGSVPVEAGITANGSGGDPFELNLPEE